jgi:putative ABC transport system permease protein
LNLDRFRYDVTSAWRLAFDSVRAHKLRSFLTLLGVIIGVASVILVGSAVEGLGVYAERSTAKAFGADTFLIAQVASAGRMTRKEYFEKLRRNKEVRQEDIRYLEGVAGDTTLYSPYRQRSSDVKREGALLEDAAIIGVSADMAQIRDIVVVEGRFFTEQEERTRQNAAVIGYDVKTTLFPSGASPLGGQVKISGIDFTVTGVQEKLGSAFGRSLDNSIYIPQSAFTRLWGQGRGIAVYGKPRPETGISLEAALDVTRAALRTRYHAQPGKPDNFDTLTPDAIRGFLDTMLALIAAVVVPVTCISLVVGGIVIMNIMLVSVTERTREIGIRKAVGARHSDIMMQVLSESVLMAVAGGALGVLLGAVLTQALSRIFEITLAITAPYVALALFVSGGVGIASGWYPAKRAAKLDPIVALRSE